MRLGGANTLFHEVSTRCRIALEASEALHLEEPLDDINHTQRNAGLSHRLFGVSLDRTNSTGGAYQYRKENYRQVRRHHRQLKQEDL